MNLSSILKNLKQLVTFLAYGLGVVFWMVFLVSFVTWDFIAFYDPEYFWWFFRIGIGLGALEFFFKNLMEWEGSQR